MGEKVNLSTVAKRAEVSVITASLAIRGVGRVKPQTRKRVLEAAESLGYKRHAGQVYSAFGHTSASEHRLRLVLPFFNTKNVSADTAFGRRIIAGAEETLTATGGDLTHIEADSPEDFIEKLPKSRVHGIILRQVLPIRWLRKIQAVAPVVYAISHDLQPGVDCALFNEFKSTAIIYDHLLSNGHRSIAWIYGERSNPHGSVAEKLYNPMSGYDRQANNFTYARVAAWMVLDLGMQDDEITNQHLELTTQFKDDLSDFDSEKMAKDASKTLLNLTTRPTAVVVYSDDVAYFLRQELQRAKIRIPEDISIVTYLSSDQNLGKRGSITGIRLPFGQLGKLIPELVQRRLSQPDAPYISVALETRLIDRGSVKRIKQ